MTLTNAILTALLAVCTLHTAVYCYEAWRRFVAARPVKPAPWKV